MPSNPGVLNPGLAASTANVSKVLKQTAAQLASGRRVGKAADDPAGLGVLTNLETFDLSSRQAARNTSYGTSVIAAAEGVSSSATDSLQRLRELSVQASSETLSADGRASIQAEMDQVLQEMDAQAGRSEYNGLQLADGSVGDIDVQVGTEDDASSRISIALPDMSAAGLGVGGVSAATAEDARASLDAIDSALDAVNGQRSTLGATQRRMDAAYERNTTASLAAAEGAAGIADLDFAEAVSRQAGDMIQQQASVAAQAQANNLHRAMAVGLLA